jgi:hypothetical protein
LAGPRKILALQAAFSPSGFGRSSQKPFSANLDAHPNFAQNFGGHNWR